MVLHIAKHELTRALRDGHTRMLFITTLLLLAAAMVLGVRDYQLAKNQYEENLVQNRLNWESQTKKDPHDAAHDGTYAIKPLHPLAMLDPGIRPYTGQVIHLGAHERKQGSLNEAKDHSELFRFGQLTPKFMLLYIFPILLVFLGYKTVTSEIERRTLSLLFAQGASSRQIVLGKWLALTFKMALLFLFFGLSIALAYGSLGMSTQTTLFEWLVFIFSYLIYLFVFVNLTILVSSWARSPGVALVGLLTFWVLITLIIPKLSSNLAGRLYPFPTLQTFKENIYEDQQNGLNGHNFWNEAAQVFQKEVLERYGVETIEDLPVDYGGLLLAEGEKYESAVYSKHFDLLQTQYHKQRQIFRLTGLSSPFLSVNFISMALARTDYNFQWHFEDKAEAYRVALNTALNMNIAENAKGVSGYQASTELWAQMPKFTYEWKPARQIIMDHVLEFAVVLAWGIGSFLAMLFFTRKIQVTR